MNKEITSKFLDLVLKMIDLDKYVFYENTLWEVKLYDLMTDISSLFGLDISDASKIARMLVFVKVFSNTDNLGFSFSSKTVGDIYNPDEIRHFLKENPCYALSIGKFFRKMSYDNFLKTSYWKMISFRARELANNKCKVCGEKGKTLNIHHNSYENHGLEIIHDEDLICLCEDCHQLFHDKQKKAYWNEMKIKKQRRKESLTNLTKKILESEQLLELRSELQRRIKCLCNNDNEEQASNIIKACELVPFKMVMAVETAFNKKSGYGVLSLTHVIYFLGKLYEKGCNNDFVEIPANEINSICRKFAPGSYSALLNFLINYKIIERKKDGSNAYYSYKIIENFDNVDNNTTKK